MKRNIEIEVFVDERTSTKERNENAITKRAFSNKNYEEYRLLTATLSGPKAWEMLNVFGKEDFMDILDTEYNSEGLVAEIIDSAPNHSDIIINVTMGLREYRMVLAKISGLSKDGPPELAVKQFRLEV